MDISPITLSGQHVRLEPLRTAHSEALVVGTTRFYEIVTADRRVAIGYTWLSQSAQRTAINTEAKLLMLTHAFEHREWAKQQGRWQLVGAHVSQVKNRSRSSVIEVRGCGGRAMNKRPISITIISWVFIAAGVVGLLFHLSEFKTQSFAYGLVWACSVRSLAILGGVFMLYGFDWARWLLVIWIAYHVVLSAFHSPFEIVFHTVLLGVVTYFLFRPRASAYFQRRKAPGHQSPTDQP